jgi:hypothetical protein
MTNLGSSQLVYNGEFEGIAQAAEFASTNAVPNRRFRIFSDNQGVEIIVEILLIIAYCQINAASPGRNLRTGFFGLVSPDWYLRTGISGSELQTGASENEL